MWSRLKKFHDYLITFPERLYPFTEVTDGGKKLIGEQAYAYVAKVNRHKFDYEYSLQAPKLLLWRQVFHLLGSVFLVIVAHLMFVHLSFFNGFAFLVLMVVAVAVQEFYLHPKHYGQKPLKGLIDFLVWMIPIIIYILL